MITIVTLVSMQWAWGQENGQPHLSPKSNLEIMQDVIGHITGKVIESVHLNVGDSIALTVQSQPESWIVEQAVAASLIARNYVVFSSPESTASAKYLFRVASMSLQVRYNNMFTEGVFGTKMVQREVIAHLSNEVKNRGTREILYSGSLSQSSSDTIAVDYIGRIEHDAIEVSRGDLPSESFLDRFIEPFVIIGATGVAIYLLFHIRS